MKNSTLLRLFFISIGLPLTCASSSSSTSSTPTPSTPTPSTPTPTPTPKPKLKSKSKSKPKTTSLLVDTTTTAPAVQPKDQSSLVQSIPEESQVSEDEQTKVFEEVIDEGQYKKMSDEELLKHLSQVVIPLDHFKDLYEHLKQRKMVPDFLAHGDMALVRKVIVETDLLETDDLLGKCDDIYDAIALSLKEDRHDRVAGLFEAAKERPRWKGRSDRLDWFLEGFFGRYPPEKNSMPLKRFLTLYGEDFSKEHHDIFETICRILVRRLNVLFNDPGSQKLLTDLIGQPSLLTPVVFALGFLFGAEDTNRVKFIKYGYKEALEEALKLKYSLGGKLWAVMVREYSKQFSGEYPSTGGEITVALGDFPTKQAREEAWIKENTPMLLARLGQPMPELLPIVLWNIVFEYGQITFTWIDV